MTGMVTLNGYRALVGQKLGTSDWILVDQDRIDRFAEATEDRQFIHIDPERARETPFGTTIAHGFLTASLLSAMNYSAVPTVAGAKMTVNYGFNSLRFLAPVKAGSRMRGHFTLNNFVERAPGQWLMTLDVTVEIEGEPRPALAAELLGLIFV